MGALWRKCDEISGIQLVAAAEVRPRRRNFGKSCGSIRFPVQSFESLGSTLRLVIECKQKGGSYADFF
jgi:hypothetical protein